MHRKHIGHIIDVDHTRRCTDRKLHTASAEFLVEPNTRMSLSHGWTLQTTKLTSIAIVIGWAADERRGVQCRGGFDAADTSSCLS